MQIHQSLKKWIEYKKWTGLNEIQSECFNNYENSPNFLIQAGTASGKTEAAFIPVLNELLNKGKGLVICVCPLRALISDLKQRIEDMLMFENSREEEVSVICWHSEGDTVAQKRKISSSKSCVVIITPESLEALVRKTEASFESDSEGPLRTHSEVLAVILDEFHVLLDSYRGLQLKGILHRLQDNTGIKINRIIALSATLSSKKLALEYFTCLSDALVFQIEGTRKSTLNVEILDESDYQELFSKICSFNRILVFPNSKKAVEEWTCEISDYVQSNNHSHIVGCHHASLSASVKEDVIATMRTCEKSITICTSTLELGIDLPQVDLVVQIGLAPSSQALRQRAGRSGRSGGTEPRLLFVRKNKSDIGDHASIRNINMDLILMELQSYMAKTNNFEQDFSLPEESVFAHQVASRLLSEKSAHKRADFYKLNEQAYPQIKDSHFDALFDHWIAKKLVHERNGKLYPGNELSTLFDSYDSLTVFESETGIRIEDLNGKYLADAAEKKQYRVGDLFLMNGNYWEIYSLKHGVIHVKRTYSPTDTSVYTLSANKFSLSRKMSELLYSLRKSELAKTIFSKEALNGVLMLPEKEVSPKLWTTYAGHRTNQAIADVYSYISGTKVEPYLLGIQADSISLTDTELRKKAIAAIENNINYIIKAKCDAAATKWSNKILSKELKALEYSKLACDFDHALELLNHINK